MKEIGQAEFNRHRIGRQHTPAEMMLGAKPTIEKRWFAHNDLLGVVVFDTIDSDWGFVALRIHDGEKVYRAYDVGTSFTSCGAAIKRLEDVLVRGVEHINVDTEEWRGIFSRMQELMKRHSTEH